MIPAARTAAAIEILDAILAGQAVEPALVNWGRAHRFAGSGDRAAIRDLVFDALRCKRSFAALGGAETGRGLMLGAMRAKGDDPAPIFTGEGHAPAVVAADEGGQPPEGMAALDCPDWLETQLRAALGDDFAPVLHAMQHRAPIYLRVNTIKATRDAALAELAKDGIVADPVPGCDTALEVTENARKIQNSAAYLGGLVELQDLSSQSLCQALPLHDGARVLDYCAGGGGKSLAMKAVAGIRLYAHDAAPQRLRDLPARAARAGAKVIISDTPSNTAPYDLILTDVPCSGSGSWRRDPQGKWALTADRLAQVTALQAQIMDQVAPMLGPKGVLAYATCSLLAEENEAQVSAFLARNSGWTCTLQRRWSPLSGGDGFFLALLTRENPGLTQP